LISRLFSVSKARCLCCYLAKFITFSQLEKCYSNRPSTDSVNLNECDGTVTLLQVSHCMNTMRLTIKNKRCSKTGTYSVPANVPPGRGTNKLKNGTSRRKRDGWQPYIQHCRTEDCPAVDMERFAAEVH